LIQIDKWSAHANVFGGRPHGVEIHQPSRGQWPGRSSPG
jgi:hypothetical protein